MAHTSHAKGFGTPSKSAAQVNREDIILASGWFFVTLFSLVLINDWLLHGVINLLAGVVVLAALWIVAYASGWVGISESTRLLLQERRTQKLTHAKGIHHRPMVQLPGQSKAAKASPPFVALATLVVTGAYCWAIISGVSSTAFQVALLVILPAAGLIYSLLVKENRFLSFLSIATATVVLMGQASYFSIACVAVLTFLLTVWSARMRDWQLLLATTVASFAVLIRWGLLSGDQPGLYLAVLLASLVIILMVSTPFAYFRREAEGREAARGVIFLSAAYVAAMPVFLKNNLTSELWWTILSLLAFIFVGFGSVAWLQHRRFSYAKYYALALIGLGMVISLLMAPSSLTTMVWFLSSILLVTAGFALKSYTIRMAGTGVLGATIAYYIINVLPFQNTFTGPIYFEERVWVGLLLAAFLPVVALWYKDLPAKGPEGEKKRIIMQLHYLASFAIISSLLWLATTPPAQGILLMFGGLALLLWGLRQRFPFLQAVGVATIITDAGRVLFIDAAILSGAQEATALIAVVIVAFVSAYYIAYAFGVKGLPSKK